MSTGASGVTTVIATRDRWSDLVDSIPRHQPPIVLVDNGSRDRTPVKVRDAFPHVRVIELGHNAGAVARNVGVRAATTPYVAFADDDSWWSPGSLGRAADHFDAHPRLGLLAARILVGDDQRLDPVCAEMAVSPLPRSLDLPGPSVLGFVACGAVVRRQAFLEAGGFDSVVHFGGEEERLALDLASRGWGLAYVDDVVAHHHPSPSRGGSSDRRTLLARNRLLTAVMRRSWRDVLTETRRAGPRGTARAVPRLAEALRARSVVSDRLQHQLHQLET